MSVFPGMTIKKYLGIVDVHVIRTVRILREEDDEIPHIID